MSIRLRGRGVRELRAPAYKRFFFIKFKLSKKKLPRLHWIKSKIEDWPGSNIVKISPPPKKRKIRSKNLVRQISRCMQLPCSFAWLDHSSFINSSGMTKFGFNKSWCAPIPLKLPWSSSRASQNIFYVRPIQDDMWVFMTFLVALDQLHWSFSDIGAHQDFKKPNFVMSELLIKELWARLACIKGTGKLHETEQIVTWC